MLTVTPVFSVQRKAIQINPSCLYRSLSSGRTGRSTWGAARREQEAGPRGPLLQSVGKLIHTSKCRFDLPPPASSPSVFAGLCWVAVGGREPPKTGLEELPQRCWGRPRSSALSPPVPGRGSSPEGGCWVLSSGRSIFQQRVFAEEEEIQNCVLSGVLVGSAANAASPALRRRQPSPPALLPAVPPALPAAPGSS